MVRVLVCDDEMATRFVLKRTLSRDMECVVAEAGNGLEALKALAQDRFDLVLLDLRMPVMDGLETLQVIRDTPEFRELAVVVLSASNDEQQVRQVIRLGVSDFLLKPLRQEAAQGRLLRIVKDLRRRPATRAAAAEPSAALERNSTVVLADGDDDFRHFFLSTVGDRYKVIEARTGVDALEAVLTSAPQAVFIGRYLQVLGPEGLAAKLRQMDTDRRTTLIAVASAAEAAKLSETHLYDATLSRTFIPDTLLNQLTALEQAGSTATAAEQLSRLVPGIRGSLITAVQQVFGMVLKMEVEPCEAPADVAPGKWFRGDLKIELGNLETRLRLECDEPSGNAYSKAMMGVEAPEDVLYEMVNIAGGRLKHAMTSHGLTASHGLPEVSPADEPSPDQPEGALAIWFKVAGQEAYTFRALLMATRREREAATA